MTLKTYSSYDTPLTALEGSDDCEYSESVLKEKLAAGAVLSEGACKSEI